MIGMLCLFNVSDGSFSCGFIKIVVADFLIYLLKLRILRDFDIRIKGSKWNFLKIKWSLGRLLHILST